MKKMQKVLTTASILAMTVMPMAATAQDVPPPTIHNGQGFIVNQTKAAPATMGQITNFVNDKSGKFITVTGRGLAVNDQSEIILSITKDTKIIDSKGKKVALQTIIDGKKVVKAFYGPNITRSLPPIGQALTLVVQDKSFLGIEGTVTSVSDKGILVTGKDLYSDNESSVLLHFAEKASIIDQEGKAIKASEIQPGMGIKAFYGPAATMSIPPQSSTNYVVVNTAVKETEEAAGTEGIITNVTDKTITVIGDPMKQGGTNYVILTVDEDTEIVDENGNPLTKDAIKVDIRVAASYGPVMTMIYPAQTHADKIVIKAISNAVKVEGTIVASDRTTKGQVYVNVGSDASTANDVILNISDSTKVIPLLAGGTELRAGTKIVAYHSPEMTDSLPGITNAEIVLVISEENAVTPR
ncbi:peptidase [Cohnella mopanensis]|uniref:peptidase n=1 Tax=Cohnella mopanensis TaxID=2911966 RepID=UPI001EF95B80|nr:peptidase [Cohnella mopanensis]